jgi:V-type H+-transporting ATPase subunit C
MAQYLLLSFNQTLPPQAHGKTLDAIVQAAVLGNGKVQTFPVSTELARFTSTDQLMSVADDLAKVDVVTFGLANRAARSIIDLQKKIKQDNQVGWSDISPQDTFAMIDPPELLINVEDDGNEDELSFDEALKKWKWNESLFSSNRSVTDMFARLQSDVNRIEEDLRTSNSAFTEATTRLQNLRRRNEGTLLVRSLDAVGSKMQLVRCLNDYRATVAVKAPIYVETANLSTVLVVVKNTDAAAFEKGYELGETYVVPNSCQKLEKDNDFVCYAVTLLRPNIDDYKTATKEKGWHVRDFKYNQTMREDMRKEAKETVESYLIECEKYKDLLENSFSHLATVWIHLRALRVFVESKLLYGIPANFRAYLIETNMKNAQRIHHELEKVFNDGMQMDDDEQNANEENEYHPYVSFPINLYGLVK